MEFAIRLFFMLFFSPRHLGAPILVGLLSGLISGYFVGGWAFLIGIGAALIVRTIQSFSAMSQVS